MMYFDVPSSKMQEQRSNKVLNSNNGSFSLTFVCPHTCYKKAGGSKNPKQKKCTDNMSIMLAPWSPKLRSLESPFQALFGKYTHTPPPLWNDIFHTKPISAENLLVPQKPPVAPPPPPNRHIYMFVVCNKGNGHYLWASGGPHNPFCMHGY